MKTTLLATGMPHFPSFFPLLFMKARAAEKLRHSAKRIYLLKLQEG